MVGEYQVGREGWDRLEEENLGRDSENWGWYGNLLQWKLSKIFNNPNEASYKWTQRVSTGHFLLPTSNRTQLHSIELLAKGVPWKSPKQHRQLLRQWVALCKLTVGCIAKNNTHTTRWTRRSWAEVVLWRKILHRLPKEKLGYHPSSKTFDLQSVLSAKHG